jgi:hypothetical protein
MGLEMVSKEHSATGTETVACGMLLPGVVLTKSDDVGRVWRLPAAFNNLGSVGGGISELGCVVATWATMINSVE